jgi:hypothetical protein
VTDKGAVDNVPTRLDRKVSRLRTGGAQVEMIIQDIHSVQAFGLN